MSVVEPRRIVLFRHAKADWPPVSDHERPLAERGRLDAAAAGRKLADTGVAFDLALCSTAVRTRETWKLAVHEFPKRPKTVYEERIYEASPGELIALLNETPTTRRTSCWSDTTRACRGWPTSWPARPRATPARG